MSDSLFESNTPAPAVEPQPTEQPPVQPQAASYDHLLAGFTNAQGEQKYATVEQALEASKHAQEHISKLEQEAQDLREAASKGATMEDILAAIQSKGQVTEPAPVAEPAPASIPEADLNELVQKAINANKAKDVEDANQATIANKARDAFGEKAEELFYQKAAESGLDKATVNYLSRTSPDAVSKLLGLDSKPQATTSVTGISTEAFQTAPPKEPVNGLYGTKEEKLNAWRFAGEEAKTKLGL